MDFEFLRSKINAMLHRFKPEIQQARNKFKGQRVRVTAYQLAQCDTHFRGLWIESGTIEKLQQHLLDSRIRCLNTDIANAGNTMHIKPSDSQQRKYFIILSIVCEV